MYRLRESRPFVLQGQVSTPIASYLQNATEQERVCDVGAVVDAFFDIIR